MLKQEQEDDEPVKSIIGQKEEVGDKAAAATVPEQEQEDYESAAEDWEEALHEVESIIGDKVLKGGKRKFRIKWKGYAVSYATWEAEENVHEDMINEYLDTKPPIPSVAPKEYPMPKNAVQQTLYDDLKHALEQRTGHSITTSEASKLWDQALEESISRDPGVRARKQRKV